jgi:DNA-binding XRE family transcriptional regulator
MPNIGKTIKEEIVRLARKENKSATRPLRSSAAAFRKGIAALKQQVAALEKQIKQLQKGPSAPVLAGNEPESGDRKARITAKGLRSLRKALRLSGEEFGKLLGVSTQAVYSWERKEGPVRLRQTTRAAVLAARGLGAREARARLAEKGVTKPAEKKARKTGKKRAAKK